MRPSPQLRRSFLFALLITVGWLFVFVFGLQKHMSLDQLRADHLAMMSVVAQHPLASALEFGALYAFLTGVSFPGASMLSLLAGALFGNWTVIAVVSIAATVGSLAAFWIVLHIAGRAVRDFLFQRFQWLNRGVQKD